MGDEVPELLRGCGAKAEDGGTTARGAAGGVGTPTAPAGDAGLYDVDAADDEEDGGVGGGTAGFTKRS